MLAASVAADAGLPGVNTLASGLAGSPDPIAVLTWDAPADGSAVHCKLSNDDVICLTEDQFRARCKVIGTLGQGSFAEVFKVLFDGRPAALKLLLPVDDDGDADPKAVQDRLVMFFREARALKQCRHRNIVGFYGLVKLPRNVLGKHPGAKDRQWGIVQEHMDGGSLSKLIQGQMANPHTVLYSDRQALAWCADIAEALAHLHSMDPMIIHRDVKQDNILLKFIDEGRLAAKLLDFGLHVLMDDDRSNRAVYRGIKTGELVDPRVVSADGALPPPLHPSTAGIRRYNAAVGEFVIRGLSCNGSLPQAALSRTTSSSKDYAEVLANGAAAGDGPLSAGAAGNGMADGAWPGFRHVGGAADEPAGCAAPAGMVFVPMVMHGKVQQHSPIGNGEQQGDRPASAGGSSSTGASCAMTIDIPGASGRGGSAGGAAAFGGMPQRSAPLPIIPPARTASPAIPISIPGGVRGGGGVAGGSLQPYMPLVHPDAGGPFIIDGDSDRDEVTPCGSRFASQAGMVGAANGDGMTMGLQSVDGGGVEGGSWHSSGGGHNGHRPPTNQVSRFFNAVIEDAHLLEERFTVMFQLTGQTGSCIYMAPEVYKREPYNEKVDVFSFGVIMYEIFARSLILFTYTPHSSPADADAYAGRVAAGFRPSRPSHLHPAIWDLITRCWQDHPARRPSMAQVLAELRLMMETNADEFGTPKCQCVIS